MSAPLAATNTLAFAGYVSDAATGAPIAGALVAIGAGPPDFETRRAVLAALPGWASAAERLDRAITRADGRFVFVNLPDGAYTLAVSAPRQPGRYAPATASATAGQASAPVAVALTPPATPPPPPPPSPSTQTARIVGRVVKHSSRRPVAGALVRVSGTDLAARTDADGRYAIEGAPLGSRTVEVGAEPFDLARRHVHLEAGEQRRLHVHLRRPRAAPGTDGKPAARAVSRPPQSKKRRT
jgi:hypothetical protein